MMMFGADDALNDFSLFSLIPRDSEVRFFSLAPKSCPTTISPQLRSITRGVEENQLLLCNGSDRRRRWRETP